MNRCLLQIFGLLVAAIVAVHAPRALAAEDGIDEKIEGNWIDEDSGDLDGLLADVVYHGTAVASSDLVAKATYSIELYNPEEPDFHFPSCSGTLIAKNIVLTAGHCLPQRKEVQMFVRVGLAKRIQIVQIVSHPHLSLTQTATGGEDARNDLALLRLEKPIASGLPALLPKATLRLDRGQTVVVAGFGENGINLSQKEWGKNPEIVQVMRDAQKNPPKTDVEQEALLAKIMSIMSRLPLLKTESSTLLEAEPTDRDRPLLKLTGGRSICHGDSGGPSFLKSRGRLVVVGVHSLGTNGECTQKKDYLIFDHQFPGYDMYVPDYVDWIRATVKSMSGTEI